ncbi:hypothetical protein H072_11124 [Dactylellina haptotyla CBS 200.50]|uniref:Reverse transcriptase domain-containing protein n=1 Tax=Dactylellina haptotyla (strain CBS 200.50) TaxID=1284197 RepID=S8B8V7_DACHA|nr:hypothetical protein H072_11124 [Dactylellina haptotyla CBS 200.50]
MDPTKYFRTISHRCNQEGHIRHYCPANQRPKNVRIANQGTPQEQHNYEKQYEDEERQDYEEQQESYDEYTEESEDDYQSFEEHKEERNVRVTFHLPDKNNSSVDLALARVQAALERTRTPTPPITSPEIQTPQDSETEDSLPEPAKPQSNVTLTLEEYHFKWENPLPDGATHSHFIRDSLDNLREEYKLRGEVHSRWILKTSCHHEPKIHLQKHLRATQNQTTESLKAKDIVKTIKAIFKDTPPKKIPKWMPEWIRTFEKIKDEDALPLFNEFTHKIPLQEGTTPKFLPVYACTKDELEALREYIEENLRKGYIRPSRSPVGYSILFVPKKNGKLQICIDYRSLNAITIKDRNSLPRIDESLDRLIGATRFTKLDIIVAYHNLRVAPKDVWKTAFRCRYGLFEYLVMPMGLTNAPVSFQTFMNYVLKDYIDKICIVYLDDILVYSKNSEEHRQHVIIVLEALDKYNLKVELEKTEFEVTECEFLGAIVMIEGIKMDPKKVDTIQKWLRPQNVKDIQAFLGLCNYYRRFIKQYSHMSTALSELTKIGIHFDITPSRIRAFNILKESFLSTPILKLYDPDLPIKIKTNASDAALGACLCQLQPN